MHFVSTIEFRQITPNTLVDLPEALAQLLTREVLGLCIHRFELAAVNGNAGTVEQVDIAAQSNKMPAHVADRRPVVLAEIGNGLEVGLE